MTLHFPPFVDARDVSEAELLMNAFGAAAALEAQERAEASRQIGNHINFCRWRQIERLIVLMSARGTVGTVH